ncbi:MAG: M23 family metallopeptidase [Myxococcota bacterium]
MSNYSLSSTPKKSGGNTVLRFLVMLVVMGVAGAAGAMVTFRETPPPVLEIASNLPGIGQKTEITVKAREPDRGLAHVKVELVQGNTTQLLTEANFTPRKVWDRWGPLTAEHTFTVAVGKSVNPALVQGTAEIRVTAERVGTWLKTPDPEVKTLSLPVQLTPPTITPTSQAIYVNQGGVEAVVYQVGETSVRDGVQVGEWFFPGYPLPGGGPQEHFALFAIPYDMTDASGVKLVAQDALGNRGESAGFVHKFFPRPMGKDTIQLNDKFLEKVVTEVLPQSGLVDKQGLLDNYLQINGELRKRNNEHLKELATKTRASFLWRQGFQPMENAKVMGNFADRRTYVYNEKQVDTQDHLGFDLASLRLAPVPSANDGEVVLAKYFGIFGNAVVVDHGFGIMSLYAHLSSIDVKEGAAVKRGQTLGKTGATGLAGGDHLHFTMLLHGLPVNPVEWWDSHWIHDRLVLKLGSALPFDDESKATAKGKRG